MKERDFQKILIIEIKRRLPDCVILKNDAKYIQGIPDLTIFYKDRWATLECKRDRYAKVRPNQEYYVDKMNAMSFSAVIYPENMEEVLDGMERSFKRRSRR